RTVCRRAERNIYRMEILDCQKDTAIFINRLSDYFFVLGRKAELKS
ncbi:MAG: ATP:cob(I)alamin adenosyltransferase, partial [Paludibacteraceae bacterium]|nr:ATP:cob(I)alamin adenosyltransferase [Paludibacteraceae bacterium]